MRRDLRDGAAHWFRGNTPQVTDQRLEAERGSARGLRRRVLRRRPRGTSTAGRPSQAGARQTS
eukprot:8939821-Pyramimonas_sp.AAC.1